jgi:phage shock protein PspC (stress-responsive transcriptional regulator)
MTKRLYRSRSEKMVGGVCGGLAEYLGMDVTLIRVLWVLVTLLAGTGLLIYVVLWVLIPLEPLAGAEEPS